MDDAAAVPETLVACVTPDEAVVCLGRSTDAIEADRGAAVQLEAVLI